MEKFRNKYRVQSHRMPGWDYSNNGIYFITIVTQNRECNMGQITLDKNKQPCVLLSDFGKIVNNQWIKSFQIRNELFLDTYIVMPNHIHAIVVLNKNEKYKTYGINETDGINVSDGSHVETHGRASLQSPQQSPNQSSEPLDQNRQLTNEPIQQSPKSGYSQQFANQYPQNQLIRQPKSISAFIAGFKSAVNSKIDDFIDQNRLDIPKYNRNNHFFQPNYHDHIIRNNAEHQRIRKYILNNPFKWNQDKFNPEI